MSAAKHFFERGRVEVNQMSADGPGYRGWRCGGRRGAGSGCLRLPALSDSKGHIPMLHRLIKPALLLGLLLIGNPAHAQGSTGRQGMLTCRTSPSLGLIIGSTQRLACQFRENSGWTQDYFGRINRIGLDIGFTAGGVMAWAVIGSSSAVRPGALTGRFVGASGEISVGVGAGANVLVGGTAQSEYRYSHYHWKDRSALILLLGLRD